MVHPRKGQRMPVGEASVFCEARRAVFSRPSLERQSSSGGPGVQEGLPAAGGPEDVLRLGNNLAVPKQFLRVATRPSRPLLAVENLRPGKNLCVNIYSSITVARCPSTGEWVNKIKNI